MEANEDERQVGARPDLGRRGRTKSNSTSAQELPSAAVCDINDQIIRAPPQVSRLKYGRKSNWTRKSNAVRTLAAVCLTLQLVHEFDWPLGHKRVELKAGRVLMAAGSLIIGDSAIEIQEVGPQQQQPAPGQTEPPTQNSDEPPRSQLVESAGSIAKPSEDSADLGPSVILGSAGGDSTAQQFSPPTGANSKQSSRLPSGPLPPLGKQLDDITDGDKNSRASHDIEPEDGRRGLAEVFPSTGAEPSGKRIAGKIVDYELTPAGGHNKAKIKKKKKKKVEMAHEAEAQKKWAKMKQAKEKAMEMGEKKHLKKKKEEGKKKKKEWGLKEHGQKKKGNFKKTKWGKKEKKGKGVKKGKKGRKFLEDKGHKSTGFKTVYHKVEYGKSDKWHDIKRDKVWDEEAKIWKNKWDKLKGKKYKGDHLKKFEKKKKEGKKYKKAKEEKFKKEKKEKFESGKKKKMEEHKKKKEGGAKKMVGEMKKKKKKKKP